MRWEGAGYGLGVDWVWAGCGLNVLGYAGCVLVLVWGVAWEQAGGSWRKASCLFCFRSDVFPLFSVNGYVEAVVSPVNASLVSCRAPLAAVWFGTN